MLNTLQASSTVNINGRNMLQLPIIFGAETTCTPDPSLHVIYERYADLMTGLNTGDCALIRANVLPLIFTAQDQKQYPTVTALTNKRYPLYPHINIWAYGLMKPYLLKSMSRRYTLPCNKIYIGYISCYVLDQHFFPKQSCRYIRLNPGR